MGPFKDEIVKRDGVLQGYVSFNVDGVARGKHEQVGIGGAIRNFKSKVRITFSKPTRLRLMKGSG